LNNGSEEVIDGERNGGGVRILTAYISWLARQRMVSSIKTCKKDDNCPIVFANYVVLGACFVNIHRRFLTYQFFFAVRNCAFLRSLLAEEGASSPYGSFLERIGLTSAAKAVPALCKRTFPGICH
jgi:hypothetical protein